MAIPAMLVLALASSAYKVGSGIYKQQQAKKEAANIPRATMPESAKTAMAEAANLASGRMAGATEAEQRLSEAAATAAYRGERAATSGGQLQSVVGRAQAMESKAIRDVQEAEARDAVRRKGIYIDQLYKMAGLEKEIEDTNKANQYNTMQAVKAAGSQEIYSGISQAANVGMTYLAGQDTKAADVTNGTEDAAQKIEETTVTPPVKTNNATVQDLDRELYNEYLKTTDNPVDYETWLFENNPILLNESAPK